MQADLPVGSQTKKAKTGMPVQRVWGVAILCGGRSRRMGRPKPCLPWGNTTLLDHVASRLAPCSPTPVILVAAPAQELPPVRVPVEVVRDRREAQGPLQGIAEALAAADRLGCQGVYITSCDVPGVRAEFVQLVLQQLEQVDAAVPQALGHTQVLAAAYATSLAPLAQRLLEQGKRKPRDLLERIRVRWLPEPLLRTVDPQLDSLQNLNTPEDYRQALLKARLPIPHWLQSPSNPN